MKVIWNNSKDYVPIGNFILGPQKMIPLSKLKNCEYKSILNADPRLEPIIVDKVDNSPIALKTRIEIFNKRVEKYIN